jgi:dTDP-4-dehydrorhamnose reductase
MLGSSLLRFLVQQGRDVFATARDNNTCGTYFRSPLKERVFSPLRADDFTSVQKVLLKYKPDIVINCIGVIKQLPAAKDHLQCIEINALFPHRLAKVCEEIGARLIHISTDCVFSGKKGMYTEDDFPDCDDLYGRTKLLGEVDYPHAVTLRTSIIGHELKSNVSLVDWFLSQEGKVKGYTKAIYTGFPTVELARIITDYVIPNRELAGLYHVSSDPISKYDLLRLVVKQYNKKIKIEPDGDFFCDRSLDSSRFRATTGYRPPSWEELVTLMHDDFMKIEEEINHGNI